MKTLWTGQRSGRSAGAPSRHYFSGNADGRPGSLVGCADTAVALFLIHSVGHCEKEKDVALHEYLLRRTTTVLNGVLDCGFILIGGACHGGNHEHASLRLPGNRGGSLHGHRNGACDAPAIGAVKSLLSTLPQASALASKGGPAGEHALRDCESSLVQGHERPEKRPQGVS